MSINAPNRIKKKYLDSDSVDGSKVLFLNEESFRAKGSADQDIELFKLSSTNKFTLLKLPSVNIDPTDMHDVVNKKYVDDKSSILESFLSDLVSNEATTRASEDSRILSESNGYSDSLVSQEASERQAADLQTLNASKDHADAQVSNEAITRASEDSRVLSESKAYTDQEVAALIGMAPSTYDTLKEIADYIAADQTGTTAILSDISNHSSRLDTIEGTGEGSIAKAEQDANSYTDSAVSAEASLRSSGDAATLLAANNHADSAVSAEALLRSSGDTATLLTANNYADSAVSAEASLRSSGDAATLLSANSYTDAEISSHVTSKLGMPSGIATLDSSGKILSSQIPQIAITDVHVVQDMAERDALSVQEGDVAKVIEGVQIGGAWFPKSFIWAVDDTTLVGSWIDIATEPHVDSINGQVGAVVLDTDDISEGSTNLYFTDERAKAASVVNTMAGDELDKAPSVSSVRDFIDEFGERCQTDSFVVDSTIITQNYIELSAKAFSMSIVPSISRLMLLEGDDYTVSVVAGKTRLTFVNSLLQGGDEALEVGDRIRIRYLKDLR